MSTQLQAHSPVCQLQCKHSHSSARHTTSRLSSLRNNFGQRRRHPHAAVCRHTDHSSSQPGRCQNEQSRRALLALAVLICQLPGKAKAQAQTAPEAGPSTKGSKGSSVMAGGITTLSQTSVIAKLSPSERQVLDQNKRVQAQNNAPKLFPGFVRRGYAIRVIADGYVEDSQGLIFKDFAEGSGPPPTDGQQVIFNYTAYNESGARVDTSYSKGRPSETRIGINGLIPGFEAGIKTMRKGGQRRIVVPPELGPPTGPATFFSAKQCEVFDVELLDVKSCVRNQVAFFSSVKCE
ncbi:hypothetical protein WJX73_001121 [Symbiochloris irregularis]|uniref:peptidylprolyl isomerase n=1 Tax=Symbiochloris irregularis TaxID=706552 RepID=A0AAW1NYA6_9CHLO